MIHPTKISSHLNKFSPIAYYFPNQTHQGKPKKGEKVGVQMDVYISEEYVRKREEMKRKRLQRERQEQQLQIQLGMASGFLSAVIVCDGRPLPSGL
jgi:alpha-galactosidase/6-phospho-beta-glucosidase family protein